MLVNETQMTINRSLNLNTGLKLYLPELVLRPPGVLLIADLEAANFMALTCHPSGAIYLKIIKAAAPLRA